MFLMYSVVFRGFKSDEKLQLDTNSTSIFQHGGSQITLVPRAYDPFGLWLGSRALVWPNTGSPRFTDFPSNLANLIG